MNREMRRLMEREERRQKKQKDAGRRAPGVSGRRPPGERRSLWQWLVTFLHEVRSEMRKVSWPSREQLVAFTAVTLITSAALTLMIFGFDVGLKEVVLRVIGGS